MAILFVLYATLATVLVSSLMPPFQAADELNHAERAYQVGHGSLVAARLADGSAGGQVAGGLADLAAPFDLLRFHPRIKADTVMGHVSTLVGWGSSRIEPFPNTAIYPPVFYLPAALGLRIGQSARLSVRHAMVLARLLTGFASTALAGTAILLAGDFAPFLFTALCLPMSLALFAAISQDGPMLACAALGSVLLARPSLSKRAFLLGCALLALVLMARPAYLPLCVAPLLVSGQSRMTRILGPLLLLVAAASWSMLVGRLVIPAGASRHIADQIAAIRHDPSIVRLLLHTTLNKQVVEGFPAGREFIGVLGWLDTTLPNPYYALAGCALLLSLAVSGSPQACVSPARAALATVMVAAGIFAIYGLQYLSWSRIGGAFIDGVQGRYFLPLAPLLILAVPKRHRHPSRLVMSGLAVFPLLSIALTLRAILVRYYLG